MKMSTPAAIPLTVAMASSSTSGPAPSDQAQAVVAAFYEAFNPAPGKDVAALLRSVTAEDWVSCSGNDVCAPRDVVIPGIVGLGQAVPNLTWEIKEMIVADNKVVVRSEANGTPQGDFIGAPYSGKSMKFMAIDIHEIRDGKIVRTYHVEDMLGAQSQLLSK